MPLQRRLPKRGFRSKRALDVAEVRLSELDKLDAGTIDLAALKAARLVPTSAKQAKVIKTGEVSKKFVLKRPARDGRRQGRDRSGRRPDQRSRWRGVSNGMARSGNAAGNLGGVGKFGDLRQRLLFLLGALVVYRIGRTSRCRASNPRRCCSCSIAAGQHPGHVQHVLGRRAVALHHLRARHHAVHLGVDHHAADGRRAELEALKKEGESGRRKITQYTRYGTLGLALFQSRRHRDRAAELGREQRHPGDSPGFGFL